MLEILFGGAVPRVLRSTIHFITLTEGVNQEVLHRLRNDIFPISERALLDTSWLSDCFSREQSFSVSRISRRNPTFYLCQALHNLHGTDLSIDFLQIGAPLTAINRVQEILGEQLILPERENEIIYLFIPGMIDKNHRLLNERIGFFSLHGNEAILARKLHGHIVHVWHSKHILFNPGEIRLPNRPHNTRDCPTHATDSCEVAPIGL